MLNQLIQTIHQSITRKDTNHPLFHGSWDWHSAVHGHWAVLHYASVEEDVSLRTWLSDRFSSTLFLEELQYLVDNPEFERPYGRAWLLPLAIAHIQAEIPTEIKPLIDSLAVDLWNWVQSSNPNTAVGEYENPSWTLLQLYMWFSFTEDVVHKMEVQDWVGRFCCGQDNHPKHDQQRQEFFSCWGVQALLLGEVLGRKKLTGWIAEQNYLQSDLEPINPQEKVHHLGMNASRAWGFWAVWQATRQAFWKKAYQANLTASMNLHSQWKADHFSYGHWVPQFTLYAYYLDSIHFQSSLGDKFPS